MNRPADESSLFPWVRATFAGWCAGVVLAIAMAAAGDLVGLSGSQFMLGVGLGIGVGFAQERQLRKWVGPRPWMWFTALGLSMPFLVGDLLRAVGVDLPYSLPLYVALGGLLAGLLQRRLLAPHVQRSWAWPIRSVLAWALAVGTVSVADLLDIGGLAGALAYVGVVALGGVALGAAAVPRLEVGARG